MRRGCARLTGPALGLRQHAEDAVVVGDEAASATGVARAQPRSDGSAERHRSRTCLASGYDAVLVLKTVASCPVGSTLAQLSAFCSRSLQFTSTRWGKKRGKDL